MTEVEGGMGQPGARSGRTGGSAEPSVDLTGLRVLVIDDNRFARSFIKTALRQYGVKSITECADAVTALKMMKAMAFDLLIVDIEMKVVDGIEFTTLVRRGTDSVNPEIPIIIVSGHAERENVMRAINAGAHAFVAKPFSPFVLFRHIWATFHIPRPFIRTANYIGPCRRSPDRRDKAAPPADTVPVDMVPVDTVTEKDI